MDENKDPDTNEPDQQDPYHFLPVDPFNMNISEVEVNQDSDHQTHDDLQQRLSAFSLSANPHELSSSQSSLNHAIPENSITLITRERLMPVPFFNNFNVQHRPRYRRMNFMDVRPFMISLSSLHQYTLLEYILESRDEREVEVVISTVLRNGFFGRCLHELVVRSPELMITKLLLSLVSNIQRFYLNCCNESRYYFMETLLNRCTSWEQHEILTQAFTHENMIFYLIMDQSGHRIAKQLLRVMPYGHLRRIFNVVAVYSQIIARDPYGSKILQDYVKHAYHVLDRENLVVNILPNIIELAENDRGNYVVQCILEEVPTFKSVILRSLRGNCARLSKQKYSSNVVEKCIEKANEVEFRIIVNELFSPTNIEDVLGNEFGNYVIKTAVCRAEGSIFEEICQILSMFENSVCVSINKIYVQSVFKVIAQKRRSLGLN